MKGLITRSVTMLWATGGLALAGGCDAYHNLVDPCYPQRYEYAARQEVNAAMAPQVANGHVLDQTVWDYHFEPGTSRLTPGGMEHLAYLARRRPCPDSMIYLQTAQGIVFDPAGPGRYAEMRAKLDGERIQAIQNFLNAQTAGRQLTFEVAVHDPSEVGMPAPAAATSLQKLYFGYQGKLASSAGAGSSNVSGGAGATGGAPPAGGSGR